MTTVRELAYKLWQIRSIHGMNDDHIRDYYDAEKLLNNQWLKKGAIVIYRGDKYEFEYVNKHGEVVLHKPGEDCISVNMKEINVVNPDYGTKE